ncbi:MAG: hypothetical protein K9J42_10595 [Sulfuritalea sp.]|nr:hypothetical protein [Sulfuritalea sp.]
MRLEKSVNHGAHGDTAKVMDDKQAFTFCRVAVLDARETLNKPSHRRKPVSSVLILLDSGFRRNDEFGLVQHFPRKILP